jgi:hypothetical protein
MRTFLCALSAIVILFPAVAGTAAEIDFEGELRLRAEADDRAFDPDTTVRQYTDMRTRLGVTATVNENASAFVQLQDSRRFGDRSPDGRYLSGTLANGHNVDIHQAYLQIEELWERGIGLKAGRFEVNLGGQRVFGAVGWHNVGRSWDGLDFFVERAGVRLDGYWLKRREINSALENDDFDILGLNAGHELFGVEAFLFWEHDAGETVDDSIETGINALDRFTTGLWARGGRGRWDYELNGVYQLGQQRMMRNDTAREVDLRAFLITAEIGYTFVPAHNARLAVAVDYASGDSEPFDETFKAYNNLYYTGHKFRGHMDYFLASEDHGLADLMLRGNLDPIPGWSLAMNIHYFRAAQSYTDTAGISAKDIGVEIDLSASTTRIAGINWSNGMSLFLPSEKWAGSDPETALWFYTMATINFTNE